MEKDNKSLTQMRSIASRKQRLAAKVVILSVGILLIGLLGISALSFYLHNMRKDYSKLINVDYANYEQVDKLCALFFEHQSLTYRYVTVMPEKEKAASIEKKASEVEEEIIEAEALFGESADGTDYETDYHAFVSEIRHYFKSVSYIYQLSNDGDFKTAEYYMDNELNADIDKVVLSVDKIHELIENDVVKSQKHLTYEVKSYRKIQFITIILMILFSGFGLMECILTMRNIVENDSLTQIYNVEQMQRYMYKQHQKGRLDGFSCICTNIKGLSLINQRYTSTAGDIALVEYAKNIKKLLAKDERIARMGGDNFLMVVHNENVDKIVDALKAVSYTINTGIDLRQIKIESRCGVYSISNTDPFDSIMNAAYIALNQAKKNAGSDVVRFDRKLLDEAYDRKILITQYKKGIDNDEFEAFYQPKTDIHNETLVGAEALVRWRRDDTLVPPYLFIPVLESEGSIVQLDFYMLERVCKDIRKWIDEGLRVVRVSSNFSKLHLSNKNFAEDILKIVDKYNIPHEYIEVELTESSGYDNFDELQRFVKKMNDNNISVSIDDFGTGYSSLQLLKDLTVDVIKIDKSLVDGIGSGNTMDENLLKNVINMIKELNKDIICEGVETVSQANFLKICKCFKVQGYLYDKPLEHDEFEIRLRDPKYNKINKK